MEHGLGIIVACVSLFGTFALVLADISQVEDPEGPMDATGETTAVADEELRRAA